jgi:hypothetical protein
MNRLGAPNHHSPPRSDTQKPPFPGSEKQNGEGHGRSEQFAVGNGRCWCRRVPLAGQLAATQWRAVRFIPGASHSPVDSPAGNSWTASRVGTDGRDRSLVVARTASKGVPAPTRPGGAWGCGGKAHRWVGPARADLRRAYTWRVRSGAAERWRWWGPLMVQGLSLLRRVGRDVARRFLYSRSWGPARAKYWFPVSIFFPFLKLPYQSFSLN